MRGSITCFSFALFGGKRTKITYDDCAAVIIFVSSQDVKKNVVISSIILRLILRLCCSIIYGSPVGATLCRVVYRIPYIVYRISYIVYRIHARLCGGACTSCIRTVDVLLSSIALKLGQASTYA